MGKIFLISLFLVTMVLSFYSLTLAQETQRISSTNSLNDLAYGKWITQRKGEAPFSSPPKAGLESTPKGLRPGRAIRNREVPMNPEVPYTMNYPAAAEIQERSLFHFENRQSSEGKSGYHFGKIYLTKYNLDPSLDFISRLSVAQFIEEDHPSWTLEKFKENGLFKSLSILLELKLNF
jgi:hypothetical protein